MPKTFMDLPPEIRNHIYSYCESLVPTTFTPSTPESDTTSFFAAGYEIRHQSLYIDCCCKPCLSRLVQPAITRVSRATRSETISMFFGSNRFFLNTSHGFDVWLRRVWPHARFITLQLGLGFEQCGRALKAVRDTGMMIVDPEGYDMRSGLIGSRSMIAIASLSNAAPGELKIQQEEGRTDRQEWSGLK